ncbi:MAG: hypothetical protein R2761_28100 [Acidimicrobiales bacterium]
MDAPSNLPLSHRLPVLAAALLSGEARACAERARALLPDRQFHVEQGNALAVLHRRAVRRHLDLEHDLGQHLTRPRWLRWWLHGLLKVLLAAAEVAAGAAALYVGGDPLPLALLAFTGVSIATVLAGSNIGIQVRRREQRLKGGLIKAGLASVALATVMLWLYRYLTLGALFGTLAFITTMVAAGSAFLAYLWHDDAADAILRAGDVARTLGRQARRHLTHRRVRRFEAAEAPLRLGAIDALHQLHLRLHRPPSPFADEGPASPFAHDEPGPTGPVAGDLVPVAVTGGGPGHQIAGAGPGTGVGSVVDVDPGMVDEVLVLAVGSEILALTPKTALETG